MGRCRAGGLDGRHGDLHAQRQAVHRRAHRLSNTSRRMGGAGTAVIGTTVPAPDRLASKNKRVARDRAHLLHLQHEREICDAGHV
jgi:hypothetical protein